MKRVVVLMVAAIAAVSLAACGSSSSSSTASGSSGNATSGASGGKRTIPAGTTIAVMNTVNGAEVTTRWTDSTLYALKSIGIKTVTANGQGDPNTQNQLIASWIQQGVKGIVLDGGFATGPIAQQLKAAQAAHIPVFGVGGSRVPDPEHLLTGNYAVSPAAMGQALAQYIVKKYPAGSQWVYIDVPAIAAAHDVILAGEPVFKKAGWKLAGQAGLLATNFATTTAPSAVSLFRAHPQAKVLFSCCDYLPSVTVPALKQAGFTSVLNTATFDDLTTLKLIREGDPVVTVAANTDETVGVAVDQLLHVLTGGTANPNADAGKYTYKVIDKSNVPPAGQYAFPPQQTLNPWIAKWKSEYNGLS